jgi:PTH2 family peptidyl-tRNA hydrolase
MSEPKQVIVMRSDLNMRKGKMVAQGAHASVKILLDRVVDKTVNEDGSGTITIACTKDMLDWINGNFTKICLGADSDRILDEFKEKAIAKSIPCAIIVDNGQTEFHGEKTRTCMAIGPADPELINSITGHLKLL